MQPSRARTRCRVDLAGGTLDIWPLGLLHRGARTVNVAIDLSVEIRLRPLTRGFRVDGAEGAPIIEAGDVEELLREPQTRLVGEVLSWLEAPPVEVTIRTRSPRGAGLGGSSAVTVGLLAAGWHAMGRELPSPTAIAAVARDLEARLMSLPTGMQDHLPALLGGALEIRQRPGGAEIVPIPVDLADLSACLVVAYCGHSHFSAGANWGIVRRRLDGEQDVTARLERIAEVAVAMAESLRSGDLPRCGELLTEEWDARRGLAPGVSTPELETLLAVARQAGAWGGKACGAGGGGCIAVLAPSERKAAVREACRAVGGEVLAAEPSATGLELLDD